MVVFFIIILLNTNISPIKSIWTIVKVFLFGYNEVTDNNHCAALPRPLEFVFIVKHFYGVCE